MNRGDEALSASLSIKECATGLGFDPVGITGGDDFSAAEAAMIARIEAGLLDGLPWFTAERARITCRPTSRFPWARSIVSVALPYPLTNSDPEHERGDYAKAYPDRFARYTRGPDYHLVVLQKLAALAEHVRRLDPRAVSRASVDTGRLPDRAIAVRAGVGWFGKHTNVITRRHGSWVFLGELITSLLLVPDPKLRQHCGACRLCIEACPTNALVAPYVLDNARCISFLTIELRESIPRDLRRAIGPRVFGCDVCQQVCPVNTKLARERRGLGPSGGRARGLAQASGQASDDSGLSDLALILRMNEDDFRRQFRDRALFRAKRAGMQRNLAVALGNSRSPGVVPALAGGLSAPLPIVRAHAAWALGQIATPDARTALIAAQGSEGDGAVREEIRRALDNR